VSESRARLLIVEDNVVLAENLDDIFSSRGYAVAHANSASAALAIARNEGFELALVDVNLPDSAGTDLLPALRDACPNAEIVVITGHATLDAAVAAVRGGAFHYVAKPFKVDELIATVDGALRHASSQRERRALERRAAEAEALAHMGTLAAGLAHEIRNPLNAALLQLHLLGRGVARLDEAAREGLERRVTIVEGELKRLERLLSDFLELARPRPMAREPVDLGALVGEVLTFQEPAAQAQGIALLRRTEEGVLALGDRERLKQVLYNLVANALEASGAGAVTVGCERDPDGERVRLRVADTGRGIPRATLARIFEPFFTTKEAGTGLGLSIVRQIVQRLGGDVEVRSVEGRGTEVEVSIPASTSSTA
jgi:signal transduction histidine kinase